MKELLILQVAIIVPRLSIYTIKAESYCTFYLSMLFSLLTLHVSLRAIN